VLVPDLLVLKLLLVSPIFTRFSTKKKNRQMSVPYPSLANYFAVPEASQYIYCAQKDNKAHEKRTSGRCPQRCP
jgi:hypothetical protein